MSLPEQNQNTSNILLRKFNDDLIPSSQKKMPPKKLNFYLLNDLAIRSGRVSGFGGLNKIVQSTKKSQEKTTENNNNFVETLYDSENNGLLKSAEKLKSDYDFLLRNQRIVIDTEKLKGDKNYHKYFLLKNTTPHLVKTQSLTNLEKLTARKLSMKSFIQNIDQSNEIPLLTIKKPKPPGYRARKKCISEICSSCNTPLFQTPRKIQENHGITLKKLSEAGEFAKDLLKFVAPNVFKDSKGFSKTQINKIMKPLEETNEKINNASQKQKLNLLEKYANKPLENFVRKEKIKNSKDVGLAYEEYANWNLANLYVKMINEKAGNRISQPVYMDLMDLYENVQSELLKSEDIDNMEKLLGNIEIHNIKNKCLNQNRLSETGLNFNTNADQSKNMTQNSFYENFDESPHASFLSLSPISSRISPKPILKNVNKDIDDLPKIFSLNSKELLNHALNESKEKQLKWREFAKKCRKDLEKRKLLRIYKDFEKSKKVKHTFSCDIKKAHLIASTATQLVENGKCKNLKKFIEKSLRANHMEKIKIKPELDAKMSNISKIYENQEKLDALLSKEFYINSKKNFLKSK